MNLLPIQFKQGSSCQMKREGLRMRSFVNIVSHSCLVYLNYFLSAFTSFTVCLYIFQDGFFDKINNNKIKSTSQPSHWGLPGLTNINEADRIPTVIDSTKGCHLGIGQFKKSFATLVCIYQNLFSLILIRQLTQF